MKYTSVTAILLAVGCVSQPPESSTSQPPESSTSQLPVGSTYYQAFDEKWKHDPGINPVFETKAEAEEYAEVNGMGNSHSYEVREVDYRYEIYNQVIRLQFTKNVTIIYI